MENFKQLLKIYHTRIYNLIKESNEIVSMGHQLGNGVRPEFESFKNFGFVCRGTSSLNKYDPKYFKIRGLGISENTIFSRPFLIYISDNNELNVEITETYTSMESKLITGQQFLPSTGDVKLLVIPVIIPGYANIDLDNDGQDDKEKVKNDINTLFNGGKNLRNESINSFFKKSSFGVF